MSTIATLAIKLVGDTTQLRSSFDQAAGIVQRTGQTMAGVGAMLSGTVTTSIMGLGMTAIKVASDQEQLQIAFTTMLGSADKAKALMEDLAQFSAATPFELPEVTGGAKQLMAFGVEAENVKDVLGRLGNLAAGVGANLGDLTYLYGTSRVQGRLFAADINQFTNRGIPLIEALAATMGVATGEIRGMVEDGKVGFAEMDAAIAYLTEDGGKFAGLMEAQSQSLQGLFSTAKDNVMLTLGEIGKVAIRELDLTPKLQQLIGVLEKIRAGVSSFAQENPQLFTSLILVAGAVAAAGPALTALGMAMMFAAPAVSALGGVLAALLSPVGLVVAAVGALAVAFATDFMGIRTATEQALAPVIAWWENLTGAFEEGQFVIDGVIGELVAAFSGLGNDVWGETDNLFEFIKALTGSREIARAVAGGIWGVGESLQALGTQAMRAIQAVITVGSGLVSFLVTGQQPMGLWVLWWIEISDLIGRRAAGAIIAFTKGPLTELRAGIVAMVADARQLGAEIFGAASKIVTAGADLLAGRTNFASFAETVKAAFAGIDWTPVVERFEALKQAVGAGIEAIRNYDYGAAVTAARDAILAKFGEIDWSPIAEKLSLLKSTVTEALGAIDWAGALGQAVDTVNGLRDGVIAWLSGAIGGISWQQISLDFAGFVSGIASKIASIDWSQIDAVALLMPFATRLVPGIGQALGAIRWIVSSENFGTLVQSVKDALFAVDWGALGESLLGLVGAVSTAIQGLDWSQLTGAGETVRGQIAALFDGVQLPAIDTSGMMANLEAVQAVLAPAFERLRDALAALPENLAALGPHLEGVAGAFGNLATAIQPVLYAVGVGLTVAASIGVNLFAAVIKRLPEIVGPIIDQVALMGNTFAGVISGMAATVSAIAEGDWSAAWESMKGIVQVFADFISGTWTNVTTQLSGIGGAISEATTNTLNDLGLTDAAATVQGILDNVTSLGSKIAEVFSGELKLSAAAPEWLTKLLDWKWPTFAAPEGLASILAWDWPGFPAVPAWVDSLMAWTWPTLTAPSWITDLFKFEWPGFPALPAWLGGGGGEPGRAIGTSYFAGGRVLVGEAGPELAMLPRGTQILTAGETRRAMAGDGGSVVIQNVTLSNDMDLAVLLGKLEDLQRRRRR